MDKPMVGNTAKGGPKPLLSICLLQYKQREVTLQCLQHLARLRSEIPFEVLLLDNGSDSPIPFSDFTQKSSPNHNFDAFQNIREFHPGHPNNPDWVLCFYQAFPQTLRLFQTDWNLGFGRGHNALADRAHGHYLLFLNNDAFPNPGSLAEGVSILENNPQIGLVGGRIRHAHRYFSSIHTPFNPWNQFFYMMRLYRLSSWITHHSYDLFSGQNSSLPQYVSVIQGSFMFMPRSVFQRIGGFCPEVFLFFEEFDLARRVHRAGYKVYFSPSIQVDHTGSATLRSAVSFSSRAWILVQTKKVLYPVFFGSFFAHLLFYFEFLLSHGVRGGIALISPLFPPEHHPSKITETPPFSLLPLKEYYTAMTQAYRNSSGKFW